MSMHDDIKTVLVSEEELKAKVAELGAQISKDYEGKNLVLVSILKGSVVFMADLMRAVSIPCSIDFMVVSSYGGSNTVTSGLVKIIKDLDGDLSGKDVLIVEDPSHGWQKAMSLWTIQHGGLHCMKASPLQVGALSTRRRSKNVSRI